MNGLSEAEKYDVLYLFGQQKLDTSSPLVNAAKRILESPNTAQVVFDMLPKDHNSMADYIAEMISGGVVDDETTAQLVCLGKDFVAVPGPDPLTWAALDNHADETFKMCKSLGMATQEQIDIFEARE